MGSHYDPRCGPLLVYVALLAVVAEALELEGPAEAVAVVTKSIYSYVQSETVTGNYPPQIPHGLPSLPSQ